MKGRACNLKRRQRLAMAGKNAGGLAEFGLNANNYLYKFIKIFEVGLVFRNL